MSEKCTKKTSAGLHHDIYDIALLPCPPPNDAQKINRILGQFKIIAYLCSDFNTMLPFLEAVSITDLSKIANNHTVYYVYNERIGGYGYAAIAGYSPRTWH